MFRNLPIIMLNIVTHFMGIYEEQQSCGCITGTSTLDNIPETHIIKHCAVHDPNNTKWCETDLESDDVLAFPVMGKCRYYVVGESDPQIKFNRMKEYCKLLNYDDCIIIKGEGSNKKFHADGKEFDQLHETYTSNKNNYLEHFITFANGSSPIMFSLKPLRELLMEYTKDPQLISSLVCKIELYVYGGFNFRCVLQKYKKELIELLGKFKKVCIYESFYVNDNNTVNKTTFPKLYNVFKLQLRAMEPFYQTLSKLIYNWNTHMVSMIKNSNNQSNQLSQHKLKIINNIAGNEDFQFVLADFALAAIYRDIQPQKVTNLWFDDNQCTKFDIANDNDRSNIYVWRDLDLDVIETLIVKYLV